ncbi:chitobiase/beta-hexosaminidase C-terminal domain-containing protein [Psychrobacillus sp. NPDC093180]|uniref:chitobiase/beta-hexosaminidase C-terminal domain-containing protein n=1 Tax=Psychrobacillus sp. NPDC093180 TaxID=3364489 RepID=UPI00381EAC61
MSNKWKKPVNAVLSASLVAGVVVPTMPSAVVAATQATDLIISEYVEGSGTNKAIELYNGTGSTIDLGKYTLELYSNGATSASQKLNLTGTLENGKTYVIYNSTNTEITSKGNLKNTSVINFSGDDPVLLKKNDEVVDSIGQVGSRIENLKDVTLVRKNNVTSGDRDTTNSFDSSEEWIEYPKDTFSNLGSHEMDASSPSDPTNPVVEVTTATITGTAKVGETLTASVNEGATNVSFQWQMADTKEGLYTNIDGATNETLTLAVEQEGKFIKVNVKGDKESSITSEATVAIAAADSTNPETPVEGMSIAEARAQKTGEVTVKGIITASLKNTLHFEDGTGALAIFPKPVKGNVGDEITVTGSLSEYNGLLQLQNATIVGEPVFKGVPTPVLLTGAEVDESNESKLAKVNSVTISGKSQNYTATDANGDTFTVRDETSNLGLVADTTYESITGIVQEFNGTFQIIPRSKQDIVADSSLISQASATPGSGVLTGSTNVTLTTTTANAEIYYTLNGDTPTADSAKYTGPITIDKNTTVKAIVKGQDGTFSEVSTFNYEVTDKLHVHHIQGEGHDSSYKGKTVQNIEGVVTYKYKLGGNNYFHMQTPDELADSNPKTSEGIVVFTGNTAANVNVGELVSVSGSVSEYNIDGYNDTKGETDLPVTQISARNDQGGKVSVVETNVTLPTPIVIDETNLPSEVIDNDGLTKFDPEEDAIDFWESLEGMRVQFGNLKAVAPQEHGDLITVLESRETNTLHGGVKLTQETANPDRIQFKMYDNNEARNFEVATGDKFTGPIIGVVNYGFQNYKVNVDLQVMKDAYQKGNAKPETTNIVKANDKLTIASYNLENFSNNKASNESPDDKAKKLARAFAKDMQSPDIIGVTEVQDNNGSAAGGTAANESYERLIAEIEKAGGVKYKYVNIDPESGKDGGAPNANIRVGFLYNPERVKLTEGATAGSATTAVGYENGKLTHNPGRIDPNNSAFNSSRKPLAAQFEFQDESVIVIANHWNSKSGDTPLFGSTQPPNYGSEVQRKKIAQVVYNFVEGIKTKNPNANIVSLGDFNDFQFTDALKIHEGTLMTNMINKVEENDRYTYLFQGNSQVLDHILVSNNLVNKTITDILHINADFTDMAGRASDHDPVMVQIDLKGEGEVVAPIIPEKLYDFKNLTTKKLIITKPSISLTLGENSTITDGVLFTGNYAEFHGEGFADQQLTIKPINAGAIIDFKNTKVKSIIIDGSNVKEIRNLPSDAIIEYKNGASKDTILFRN